MPSGSPFDVSRQTHCRLSPGRKKNRRPSQNYLYNSTAGSGLENKKLGLEGFWLHFLFLFYSIYLESLLYAYRNSGIHSSGGYLFISLFNCILSPNSWKILGTCLSSSLIIYFVVNYNKSVVHSFPCFFIFSLKGFFNCLKAIFSDWLLLPFENILVKFHRQ